jgi:general secretion pathway protein K
MKRAASRANETHAKGRRRRRRAGRRGVALIMVMATLSVMTVLLAELTFDASSTLASAMAARDAVQAEYIARSAVNLSRLLIAAEPTMRAAIAPLFALMKRQPPQLPVWEFADRILAPFNDEETAKAAAKAMGMDAAQGKNLGMPGGSFELAIVDEDSKINVNLGASNDIAHIRLAQQLMAIMGPMQYAPLFEQRDAQGNTHDRLTICGAIIDWADVDESAFSCNTQVAAPTSAGVEDAYYQLLPKPFRRKNAPFDSLEELHMVRGVGDDFWATFVDPDPQKPEKRVVTVWGQGAVNVNSANPQTLLGMVCSGAPTAEICTNGQQGQAFLMGVTMARAITMGAPLFGSPQEFIQTMKGEGMLGPMLVKQLGMKPVKFLSESEFSKAITTESKVFSMMAVGVVRGYKRDVRVRVHAVVDFRQAPALGAPGAPPSGTAAAPPAPMGGAGAQPSQGAIQAALVPSTGGNVVYYRVE